MQTLAHLVRLWSEAAQQFTDTAATVPTVALNRRTYLEWTAKQIVQHVAHIECAVMRIDVPGALPYEASEMTDYIDAGAASLDPIALPDLVDALGRAALGRAEYFAHHDDESEHWRAVAVDRVLDLWVHTYDLMVATGRDPADLHATPAGRFTMNHLVARLPRVERKARKRLGRDVGFRVVLTSQGGDAIVWESEHARTGRPATITATFDSFVGMCSGRPFGQAEHYSRSSDLAVRAFAAAANHFTPTGKATMTPAPSHLSPDEESRVQNLIRSPRMKLEDRAMLLDCMDFDSEARSAVLAAYETTNL